MELLPGADAIVSRIMAAERDSSGMEARPSLEAYAILACVSDRDVELVDDPSVPVRRFYARFKSQQNALDRHDALELMAEDIVFDFSRRQIVGEVYHGHEGVRRFIRQFLEGWSDVQTELSEFIVAGDRVLVLLTLKTRGRSTGLEVAEQIAHLWTVNNGKATRLDYFGDIGEARQALRRMPEPG
jgi:ketosteroid isomerase-like protein